MILKNKNIVKKINLLDCTLRDGGYYNNWNFSKEFIQKYLNYISKTKINHVELGFRFIEKSKIKGLTAYTTDKLLNNIRVPKEIDIGIMVNASDLINNKAFEDNCKKIFHNIQNSKVKFVRFACHHHEVFLISRYIKWLKNRGLKIFVNIMQISELDLKKINRICIYLKKLNVDVVYIADSLGSLSPQQTKNIIKLFKFSFPTNIGIHAHNNLGLALKNSITASENGANWLDCTITGMGRGPGNLKTEEILSIFGEKKDRQIVKFLIKKLFIKLKTHYKWGPNKYYALAAKHKIHPTYIQKILADKRYTKKNYISIINNLKKTESKKFNPLKFNNSTTFLSTLPKGADEPKKIIKSNNFLIIGSGSSVKKYKNKILDFIKNKKPFVFSLNTESIIKKKLIDIKVACHPMRILADINYHNKSKAKIAIPYSMMPKDIRNSITLKKRNIIDYGMLLNFEKNIIVKRNYCILPYPLAIGYCLGIIFSCTKKNTIHLAGFDGYEKASPDKDNTEQVLKLFKKKYANQFFSITPSNYTYTKNKKI